MSNDLTLKSSSTDEVSSVTARRKAKQHFIDTGEWQKYEKPVMHHFLPCWRLYNKERYNQWNIEDLVLMEDSAHRRLHSTGQLNGMYGKHQTEESKKIISEKATGRQHTEEAKEKMRGPRPHTRGENHPRWGKPGTNLGRKFSKSWCQHISENHADMQGENNPMYGKHMSEEAKQKSRIKHSKPIKVTNLSTGEVREFPCASCEECAEYLGYKNSQCCSTKVSFAIKNNSGIIRKGPSRKTYDAFKVEYIKEGSVNKLE